MANHVFAMEEIKTNLVDLSQHFNGMTQTGLGATRQVNLGDIAGDNRFGVKADTGQEHFHLFDGGVLALIKNDERIVECTSAHIGQRCNFNDVTFNQLFNLLKTEHFEQRVIQRS
ncbi:hypothetical protein SDC9_187018 [bioreactor metagenome]|uniref:Uncharacterized protein n=1 Tax=bioreactor metagenome TaxID=1076179 RepID=A0A645HL63_9ZZZZ